MGEEGQQQGVKEGQQCLCYTDSPVWPWPKCCLVVLEQDVPIDAAVAWTQ